MNMGLMILKLRLIIRKLLRNNNKNRKKKKTFLNMKNLKKYTSI